MEQQHSGLAIRPRLFFSLSLSHMGRPSGKEMANVAVTIGARNTHRARSLPSYAYIRGERDVVDRKQWLPL